MSGKKPSTSKWLTGVAIVLSGTLSGGALAQEPDPRVLLNRMSAEIAGLKSFVLSGEAYADARLDAGQIIEHSSQVTMRVRQPDAMYMTNRTSEDVKELHFDSGILTVYTKSRNFYAQKAGPENVDAAVDFAINEIGIDAPMLDFVTRNVAEDLLAGASEVQHLGTSLIRGKVFEHVAIRSAEVDVQIWIASEGPPLPGKMAISAKWEGGAPRTVVFMHWDTDPDIPDGSLRFVPPEGATKISFLPKP